MPVHPAFERVENDLFLWKHLWLLSGQHLSCRYCERVQTLDLAHQPFSHDDTCPGRSATPQYPWRDLVEVLSSPYRKTPPTNGNS